MLGADGKSAIEIRAPIRQRFPWNPEDEVDVEVDDARLAEESRGAGDIRRIVPTLERLEVARIKALRADRNAVHTCVAKHARLLEIDRFGIGFHGPLDALRQRKPTNLRGQRAQLIRRQQRRRSAANEHRLDFALDARERPVDITRDLREVVPAAALAVDERIEVAIVALVKAERHMNIEPARAMAPPGQHRRHRYRRGSSRGQVILPLNMKSKIRHPRRIGSPETCAVSESRLKSTHAALQSSRSVCSGYLVATAEAARWPAKKSSESCVPI